MTNRPFWLLFIESDINTLWVDRCRKKEVR